jgi:hypothetical protein
MINFVEVEKAVKALKAQFSAGQIDEKTFENRLLELVEMGNDGYYWMFGHESERWYRYDGEKWLPIISRDEVFQPLPMPVTAQPDPTAKTEADWRTLDVGWFMASLVVIAVIGGIVYASV